MLAIPLNTTVPDKDIEDFRHWLRAIRENIEIAKSALDRTGNYDRGKVGCLIGQIEALKLMGFHPPVETKSLSRWLWLKMEWHEAKNYEEEV